MALDIEHVVDGGVDCASFGVHVVAMADFWKHQRPRYLLSGLMKCRVCGSSYTKYGQNRFACAALRDRGTCGNRLTVRGDEVRAAILDGLYFTYTAPVTVPFVALMWSSTSWWTGQ